MSTINRSRGSSPVTRPVIHCIARDESKERERERESGRGKRKRASNLQSTTDSVIQVPLLPGGSYVSSSGRVSALKRISPWSGENNGRTFYYQIDLWISSRVPTTEVYTAASPSSRALSAVNRRRLSPIGSAGRICFSPWRETFAGN